VLKPPPELLLTYKQHWHGIAQSAYPFSDGTPLASQWPIPPLHYFDYEVQFAAGSAGTYFYHSHVGFQGSTASGSLVIEDSGISPYPVDDERTILLQELFNKTDTEIAAGLVSTPLIWSGETNGFMVNGKTISNWGIVDPTTAKLEVIQVVPGRTYRFRFIGATALSYASLAFDSHNLTIIEADGKYTKPYPINLLQLGTGQRFSALFKAKTCAQLIEERKLDYYLQLETRDRPSLVTNYAILSYANVCGSKAKRLSTSSYPSKGPLTLPPTISGFLDYQLAPLKPNNFPSASEVTRRVFINVQQVGDGSYYYRDNNISWTDDATDPLPHTTPSTPYLVSLYENQTAFLPNYNASVANGGSDPKLNTFPAKLGEVIEVVLQNLGGVMLDGSAGGFLDPHPWHVHGDHVYDAGAGQGAWSSDVMESRLKGTIPVQRDSTILFNYQDSVQPNAIAGWRAWRIRVLNPGVWMIHCHTLQHMVMGMQTVWVFGDAKDILKVPKPQVEGFLTYGGSVYGNSTHVPKRIHFSEVGELQRKKT
jgi:L-ascorbate oxidase